MPLLHIAVLAVIQGVTEFLPISSSGHLVLVPYFTGWPDQGLAMDVAVHVGTLGAVCLYLWRDLHGMLAGLGRVMRGRRDPNARLAAYLVVGTLPVVAAGLALQSIHPDGIRSLTVIAWTTLGFGLLLGLVDKATMTLKRIEHMGWFDAVFIGISQVLALVPGTSRSGITMTAARLLGMERSDAARFSMLLSIPAIIGAGTLEGWKLFKAGETAMTGDIFLAAGLAFVAALIAIALMMAWLKKASFTPFVAYRVVLGLFLLMIAYGWEFW